MLHLVHEIRKEVLCALQFMERPGLPQDTKCAACTALYARSNEAVSRGAVVGPTLGWVWRIPEPPPEPERTGMPYEPPIRDRDRD